VKTPIPKLRPLVRYAFDHALDQWPPNPMMKRISRSTATTYRRLLIGRLRREIDLAALVSEDQ
jgi:hypothetical protein